MKPYSIKIPAAGSVEIAVGAGADYVRAQVAPVDLVVRVLDTDEQITLSEGDDAVLSGFSRVEFSHAAGADQAFTVLIGRGTRSSSARVSGNVSISKPSTLASTADVVLAASAQTLIKAANATRREIIIKSLSENLVAIRVGENAAAAARGHELMPGESITLTTTAAVYAWNLRTVAQSVSVVEVSD